MKPALLAAFLFAFCVDAATSKFPPAPQLHPVRWYNAKIKPDDLRGRVVLLAFWATWSKASVASHPDLHALANSLKNEKFSAILYHSRLTNIEHIHDVPAEKVLPFFIAENRVKLPVAIAGTRDFAEYDVIGLPRFVLVDKRGAIRSSSGKMPSLKTIQALLSEADPPAATSQGSRATGSRATLR
jgi:thiol-disulfide isomerase/thioredoxin